jgi:signal peptidase I
MSSVPSSDPAPRRSTVAAGVLSFFAPGAGHIYIGQYRRGIMLLLAFILLQPILLIAGFLVRPTFYAVLGFMLVILAATILVTTFIMIDAIRLARRDGQGAPWYLWIGAILACWIGFFATSALGGVIKPQLPWRTFSIPSSSMEPTIHLGEWLLADTRYYDTHAPARGDLAIYRLPTDNETIYIKRIVGLPGDRIAFRGGHAVVNGAATDEPFADFGDPKAFLADTAEVTVPPDQLFVAGDNRANSSDSRVTRQHGMVPFKNLVARATEVFMTEEWSRAGLWVGSPKAP